MASMAAARSRPSSSTSGRSSSYTEVAICPPLDRLHDTGGSSGGRSRGGQAWWCQPSEPWCPEPLESSDPEPDPLVLLPPSRPLRSSVGDEAVEPPLSSPGSLAPP